jgi:hypothetical protein
MAKASKGLDERHCRTWDDLRAQIQGVQATLRDSGEVLWFRGCREANHSLLPSLMRDTTNLSEKDHDQFEQDVFFEFQARAGELRTRNLSEWEYLFYGRHYGVPTRTRLDRYIRCCFVFCARGLDRTQ